MADVNAMLSQRTKKSESTSKMAAMAKQSSAGYLTSFSGIFNVTELSPKEKETIEAILKSHAQAEDDVAHDLPVLLSLTSEVKAINNQAALLHGERIKKAQQLLLRYREGAFTAWLLAAYGNRQTPYNLMQYYEFYEAMPKHVRPQMEAMPRQAVYTLATRKGTLEDKQAIVENYQGETKKEVLELIRKTFPLDQKDKRRRNAEEGVLQLLRQLNHYVQAHTPFEWSTTQKKEAKTLLQHIHQASGL